MIDTPPTKNARSPIAMGLALLALAAPLSAQRAPAGDADSLFQAALAAEKGAGDADKAIDLYRQVADLHRSGRGGWELAQRARQRLVRLGAERPAPRPQLGDLGLQLAPGRTVRLSDAPPRPGFFRTRLRAARAREDSFATAAPRLFAPVFYVERQIRALRRALGATGLLEYAEALAAERRSERTPNAHELYLQGLYAERERGDRDQAVAHYRRALAIAEGAPGDSQRALARRIRQRLQP